jgi:PIN domain nuclease of toxin-antitoxin system
MQILLDTHALIWWVGGDAQLSRAARKAIGDEDNEVLVSAASAFEIATKFRIGRLPEAGLVAEDLPGCLLSQDFKPLAITFSHGQRAGALPGPHGDPFDRMLIAQAQAEGIPIVSNETAFDGYGIRRIW